MNTANNSLTVISEREEPFATRRRRQFERSVSEEFQGPSVTVRRRSPSYTSIIAASLWRRGVEIDFAGARHSDTFRIAGIPANEGILKAALPNRR
ncbi:MAG TPA: hypothetical protein VGL71_06660, partial [Urbifossiella sp.]